MSKRATLLLIIVLAVSNLSMVSSAFAQLITKPSIPEFRAEYVDNSYDIAPTYTTDPYTNNIVIQTYGDHVDNRTVVITIKNEPFTPFTDTNGNTINMFYNVRYKGTYGQDWTLMYGIPRTVLAYGSDDIYGYKIQDYASQNTVIAIKSPAEGIMDIQVEALKGYTNRTLLQYHIFGSGVGYTFYGEESGWSNTQTITISETQTPTPSPATTPTPKPTITPYQEPQQTEQELIIGVAITVAVIGAGLGLLLYLTKRK